MKLWLLPLAALLGVSSLGAQGWEGDQSELPVPSTASARQSDFSSGLLAKVPVERLKPLVTKDVSGVRISAQLVKGGTGENRLWELRWEPGAAWGPGTWVAFRDGLGRLREVRVILLEGSDASDHKVAQPGTWIRLVPDTMGRNCRLDLFLAGRLVTGGWAVPVSLLDVMASSDSWLWDTTSADLDWGGLMPQRRWEDEKVEGLQVRMHKLLSTVPEAKATLWLPDPQSSLSGTSDTGAPWGAWVFLPGQPGLPVRGLGPWGVTLWTATGVLRGWKADFPSWKSLFESRIELPGYSHALVPDDVTGDPAFGMDWVRNLGLAVYQVLYPNRPRTDDSADVKDLPFLDPVPGAGYAVDDIPALVHLLAVKKPGQAYLATLSVQQADRSGTAAVTFREPAVLLPWVGQDQRIRVSVYAGPREMTLDQWLSQVPRPRKGLRPDHVALVSLPLPPSVEFPLLPAR
jgi:hypothetical protein